MPPWVFFSALCGERRHGTGGVVGFASCTFDGVLKSGYNGQWHDLELKLKYTHRKNTKTYLVLVLLLFIGGSRSRKGFQKSHQSLHSTIAYPNWTEPPNRKGCVAFPLDDHVAVLCGLPPRWCGSESRFVRSVHLSLVRRLSATCWGFGHQWQSHRGVGWS